MINIRKRYITLIEIMIVMFLIALITAVIAYNYRGSLEEGKAFKTKAAMEKLETILNLKAAEDPGFLNDVESQWQEVVNTSPLVKDPRALVYDGWGYPFRVEIDNQGTIRVTSEKYNQYVNSHPSSMFKH
jgi:general secretion pathway protein G